MGWGSSFALKYLIRWGFCFQALVVSSSSILPWNGRWLKTLRTERCSAALTKQSTVNSAVKGFKIQHNLCQELGDQKQNFVQRATTLVVYLNDEHVDHSNVSDVLVLVKHLPHFVCSLAVGDVQLKQRHCRQQQSLGKKIMLQSKLWNTLGFYLHTWWVCANVLFRASVNKTINHVIKKWLLEQQFKDLLVKSSWLLNINKTFCHNTEASKNCLDKCNLLDTNQYRP